MKFNFEKQTPKNPLKSSPIPEKLELKKQEKVVPYHYKDKSGKIQETYFEVFKDENQDDLFIKKDPEFKPRYQDLKTEYMISLFLKGIFHSSDLIKKENEYYSKVIDLEETERPNNGEAEAEIFLLRYLFADWDKNVPNNNICFKKEKFAHFDYGEAFRGSHEKDFKLENKTETLDLKIKKELKNIGKYGEPWGLKRKTKTFLNQIGMPARPNQNEIKKEIIHKSEELLARTEDLNFWNAILKKSEFKAKGNRFYFLKSKNKTEELRTILKERLEKIIKLIKK